MCLFPEFMTSEKIKKATFMVISIKASIDRTKRDQVLCSVLTLQGLSLVLCKALLSSTVVSASFFGKVILQFSGNVTCMPVQVWARDSFSQCHMNEVKVPLSHLSRSEQVPLKALGEFLPPAHSLLLPCAYSTD